MAQEINSEKVESFLRCAKIRDLARGRHNLHSILERSGKSWLPWLADWQPILADSADPDMALNNLERLLDDPANNSVLQELLRAHPEASKTLVALLATSQFLSDTLALQPSALKILEHPLRYTPTKAELIKELLTEVDKLFEDSAVLRAIRAYRARQMLRIGTNDIIRDRPLEEITADISTVAEAAVEVCLHLATQTITKRFGEPVAFGGSPGRAVVLAFGKLGGDELNYSSDIDLMVIYEQEGKANRLDITLEEFYSRVTTEMLRLLTAFPAAYRVDFRLRPEGKRGPLVRSLASTLSYYDTLGRTWERQALIKVRPIAGDLALGERFLTAIEPYVYRKYLSHGEIQEIKAIKRKIEQRAQRQGESLSDVKAGVGGIRDVEFAIQFLQLLNGGDLPQVRQRNTLLAIQALTTAGCLTSTEGQLLENSYRFLRKTEHRLQLLSDLQTHHLPERGEDYRRLALRLGFSDQPHKAEKQFRKTLQEMTKFNRTTLNHLLHDAFQDQAKAEPEADLILLPEIEPDTAKLVLSRYGFRDIASALNNLQQLAREPIPFLSTRRCRHFLAAIAPQLLKALSETPDPDMALTNLEKVTASLGAKGVLWELFSFNPPSLKLYVELCAWSPFLSQILTSHPGMIDELLDSLILDQPRSLEELRNELTELCRGADPQLVERTLHSFQNKELLRIGVCDILEKRPLRETLAALSDLAEVILGQIVAIQFNLLSQRLGAPCLDETAEPCRFVLLGLGKFGGREISYQSDLDLVLIYEVDGRTRLLRTGTTNVHFFSELAQAVIKALSHLGPMGRLYQVDMRLRPTGKSGTLAVPLAGFRSYYAGGQSQLWERQALTRARVVFGDSQFGETVLSAVHEATYGPTWQPEMADEILEMRNRLEASRSERDIKRGMGGIVDIEFLVQLLQLAYGKSYSGLDKPNVWDSLQALCERKLLTEQEYNEVKDHYEFLRKIESRLRIVHNQSQDELPESAADLNKLARRLGYASVSHPSANGEPQNDAVEEFQRDFRQRTTRIRQFLLSKLNQVRMMH
jgi:glutamate-ammonia-ligase adenylyltransferase